MAKFRFHRGDLVASMATETEVASLASVIEALSAEGWPPGKIEIKPYAYDARIGWDSHIVTLDGAAVGFTDGPLT